MADEQVVIKKVLRRLIPFCMVCYLLNYIDRVNVSVAQLTMIYKPKEQSGIVGFDDGVFNIGLGLFFVGYCLFEVPSNLIQEKVGPRRWIARIMVSWGIVTTCMVFVNGAWSFYMLRLLLGVAEAGFFPGMILYFSHWVPHRQRAKTMALFLTSTAISGLIGNPLGGFIMYLTQHGPLGIAPWQWLFICEGFPAILMGIAVWYFFTDKPADARWLSADERQTLVAVMAHEKETHIAHHATELRHAFSSKFTWLFSAMYGVMIFGFYQINFYTPKIIKQQLLDSKFVAYDTPAHGALADFYVALLSAIPFGAAAIGMVLIGRSSDKRKERKNHLAFTCFLSMFGMAIAALGPHVCTAAGVSGWSTFVVIGGLSIGAIGAFGMFGPFWALPTQVLTGTAAAASVAVINSIGNFVGGYGGTTLRQQLRWTQDQTLLVSVGLALVGFVMALVIKLPQSGDAAIKNISQA